MRSLVCVGLLAGPAALGQDDGGEGEKQGEEQKWDDLPSTFAEGWERLQANYPRVMCGFSGPRVSDIYGTPFGGGGTPEESVENFLKEYGGLFGLPREELVLTSSIVPDDGGPVYLYYAQIIGDTCVHNGAIVFTLQNRPGYAISHVSSGLHPSPRPYLTDPKVSADEALAVVRDLFGESFDWSDALLTVDPRNALPDYVWQVDVRSLANDAEAYSLLISATTGEVIDKRLSTDHANFTVTVKGLQSEDQLRPPYTCDTDAVAEAQKYVRVTLNGGSTGFTNGIGQFTFTNVPNLFTIEAKLESQYFKLIDQGGSDPYTETLGTGPGGPSEITFDTVNPARPNVRQQINTWKWLHAARDWVQGLDNSYPMGGFVNVTCNDTTGYNTSFYTPPDQPGGPALTFKNRRASEGACDDEPIEDQHFSTLVGHEYGHHLHTIVFDLASKTESEPWKESIADALSAFVVQSPILFKDICNCDNLGNVGRNLTISNEPWPAFRGDYHFSGVAMARAYWSMRSAINNNTRSGKILLHSIKKLPQGVDRRVALHAVLVDDTQSIFSDGNDNLGDGSPNYEKINEAFRQHGLATDNVAYVTMGWLPFSPTGDPAPATAITVNVGTTWNGETRVSTNPLKLRYRRNGGPWYEANMSDTSGGNGATWSAIIPANIGGGSNNAAGDVIDYFVRAEVTNTAKRYTCLPTQAQFVFSASGYTPEERDFKTLLVTAADKVVSLSTDLGTKPSSPAWIADPEPDDDPQDPDGFYFGYPSFADSGEQPSGDFPYDNDGFSIGKCYFTHKNPNKSVNSRDPGWTLTTAPFDLETGDPDGAVVSYALWFYARYGRESEDRFQVSIDNGEGQVTILETVPVVGADCAATARYPWVRRRIKLPSTVTLTDNMTLIFHVSGVAGDFDCPGESNAPRIEAAIDEVRVWGYHAN